jgi:hypothetical protein
MRKMNGHSWNLHHEICKHKDELLIVVPEIWLPGFSCRVPCTGFISTRCRTLSDDKVSLIFFQMILIVLNVARFLANVDELERYFHIFKGLIPVIVK